MNRAGVVWPEMAKFADLSLVTNAQASSQPNPAVDGFRSFMTPDGTSVRNTWPLPRDAIKQIHSETNCEGCSKATVQQHSHSQRTGLWITLCMVHETIIEYHLIKNGEGRRDCLIPLFRFKKEPPEAVFCDTACFCEESGLKWLPGFFKHTKWFHDLFHGYAHVCPSVFTCSTTPRYSWVNTSLMEQCNRFFQSIRGLLGSSTTKVSSILSYQNFCICLSPQQATLMFWTDVFAFSWNSRKLLNGQGDMPDRQ